MQVTNQVSSLTIHLSNAFNFKECLVFLGRSDQELLHHIKDDSLYKLIQIQGKFILLKISGANDILIVEFPHTKPYESHLEEIREYVSDFFDLERDLSGFYQMASKDPVLQQIAKGYYGLRIIGIPDLFEALTWAIMGQQINLRFAYTLKKRFIEQYGEKLEYEGMTFWLYPSFQKIARLDVEDLRKLQLTTRKSEYVINVAHVMATGQLSKTKLLELQDPKKQHQALVALKGVGAWTADYVIMKSLLEPTAFPIADVGLHNAIKAQLNLDTKPKLEDIAKMAGNWGGWEAYATFYLWRSLYE